MESKRGELLNQIDRFSHDLSADHRPELRELKNKYNQIMDDMENVSCNARRDILDVFPSELWIQIVKDALPARGYSSALLLLTMVSNKWMQALISVPSLWAFIELRGSQEDSLATIEVFKRLSGDTCLRISIYVPTRHDISLIHDVLAGVTPRLCEVTIKQDVDNIFYVTETRSVLSLLLKGRQYTSSVVYIHIEWSGRPVHYSTATALLITDGQLPPLLRGLSGWRFLWKDFQHADNYLQNIEEIESYGPLELVLTNQIQLPRLTSVQIYADNSEPSWRVEFTAPQGLPRLYNLTSLTYKNAFREALMQLLASVAPQLMSLDLRIPHAKIPLLVPCLQAAMSLRRLSVDVAEWNNYDQGKDNITDPLVLPVIVHNVPSLRELTLRMLHVTIPGYTLKRADSTFKGPLLRSLIRAFSLLYQNAHTVVLWIDPRYPTCTMEILGYLSGLGALRKLRWRNCPEHSESSEEPMMEMRTLEYLDTNNLDLLFRLRAANLLSLSFSGGYHGVADNLTHDHVRKLQITYTNVGPSMLELPGGGFKSVLELALILQGPDRGYMADEVIHRGLKLTSFQTLSSIAILSSGYASYQTMLCFSLLYQLEECPALNEIRFGYSSPDWDALFFMLRKCNFMLDTSVSRIRAITLPFIPNELREPLAALLGGRHAERPSNEDLILGGAQELIFDETMSV